jgi:hypothetical protein
MSIAVQGSWAGVALRPASQKTRHGRPNVSRTKFTHILTVLAAVAIPVAGLGQDATPSGTQSANQSSPAASVAAPDNGPSTGTRTVTGASSAAGGASSAAPNAGGQPTGGASQPVTGDPNASGGASATKPAPVCFKLSGRCVEPAKQPAAQGGKPVTLHKVLPQQKGSLNLAAPDVRSVMSADEMKEPLPNGEQVAEVQESETVSVKGEKDAPDVPGGFGAIWWAFNHPSQSWRIFAPAE